MKRPVHNGVKTESQSHTIVLFQCLRDVCGGGVCVTHQTDGVVLYKRHPLSYPYSIGRVASYAVVSLQWPALIHCNINTEKVVIKYVASDDARS
mgnify:CR=1 FL=1